MKHANYAHYWCAQVVEDLIGRQGIDHFFVAAGSRSTPIVSAIARNKNAKVFYGIDERSIGFMALGYGKRANKPGIVVVTSGTAVANLYPAVVEAFLSETPLLLFTADRPYELRDCGANQTIVQANIFANHINRSFDLAPPSIVVSMEQSLAIFEQAADATKWPRRGPVHVNIQLREPVANLPHEHELSWDEPTNPVKPFRLKKNYSSAESDLVEIKDVISGKKGLLVIGELLPSQLQDHIASLAETLCWPIFADVTSNVRFRRHEHIIHNFELALLNPDFLKALNDLEIVLKFGTRIVSKRFWSWVKDAPARFLSLSDSSERIDHVGRFEHVCVSDVQSSLSGLRKILPRSTSEVLTVFKQKSEPILGCVTNFLATRNINEAYISARLIALIHDSVNLFVSSSMPIRDLDQFAMPSHLAIDVFANRGASGIDGIASSAIGVSVGSEKPTILLTGDMAFLHDTNGLMLLNQAKFPILIVVINNGGGGIFHLMPIAKEPDVITPYLDTPHVVNIASLCLAHGVRHQKISDKTGFDDAIRNFFGEKEHLVLEVMVDRQENVNFHQELYGKIANLEPVC